MNHLAPGPLASLHLGVLRKDHGLTADFGGSLAEAASVCLEEQQHPSGVVMNVRGSHNSSMNIHWDATTEQTKRTWADEEEATEHGAYACAILILKHLVGLQVVERSRKGTGFDWWLGSKEDGQALFQKRARLEVSGIRNGTERLVESRLKQKTKQTKRSDQTGLPAWVTIVEFSEPHLRLEQRP